MEIALDRPRRLTIPAHTHLALAGLLRVYQAALGGSGTEGARLPTGLRGAVEMKSLRQMDLGDEDVRALVKARVLHLVAEGPPESPQLSSVPADPIRLAPSSCLALTADGATQVAKISGVRALGSLFDASGKWIIDFALLRTARPRWDEERRELSFGPLLVKRYRQPARDQELILTAFAEEGWPPRMDDPLPRGDGRDPVERLHNTINHLNRSQVHALIHFGGDGTGRGIMWDSPLAPCLRAAPERP